MMGFNTKQQPRESTRMHQPRRRQQRQHQDLTGNLQAEGRMSSAACHRNWAVCTSEGVFSKERRDKGRSSCTHS